MPRLRVSPADQSVAAIEDLVTLTSDARGIDIPFVALRQINPSERDPEARSTHRRRSEPITAPKLAPRGSLRAPVRIT